MAQKYHYIFKENGGKHTALNIGISMAGGVFFIILDSDDWLEDFALERLQFYCNEIIENPDFCGVMARCKDAKTDEMLGYPYSSENKIASYFDFHFKMKNTADSLECNKTIIMKKYKFPEPVRTKFVPEAWLFDQIGIRYKLILTNEILEVKDYQLDGISNDREYKIKNNIGFLYHYVSRIENVLPYAKTTFLHKSKCQIIVWWRYWQCVSLDSENEGPRVSHIPLYGYIVKTLMPFINICFKIRYKKIYEKGR